MLPALSRRAPDLSLQALGWIFFEAPRAKGFPFSGGSTERWIHETRVKEEDACLKRFRLRRLPLSSFPPPPPSPHPLPLPRRMIRVRGKSDGGSRVEDAEAVIGEFNNPPRSSHAPSHVARKMMKNFISRGPRGPRDLSDHYYPRDLTSDTYLSLHARACAHRAATSP